MKKLFIAVLFLSILAIALSPLAEAQSPLLMRSLNPPSLQINVVSSPEVIFPSRINPCNAQIFLPDNPVRAFKDTNNVVHVFANHYSGYYQLLGNSLNGPLHVDCTPVLSDITIGTHQNIASYKNYIWVMSSWMSINGNIMLLVHNEFHGDAFGKPGPYCKISAHDWKMPECQYWNIAAAQSNNNGKIYQWIPDNKGNAQAIITSPYKYDVNNKNLQGTPAQTNIVQDPNDPANHYLLVQNYAQGGHPIGICLFRSRNPSDPLSWRGWDGKDFTIAMNQNPYTTAINNPQVCKDIPSLPSGVSAASLSYYQPAKQYILTTITTAWPAANGGKEDAFIYFTSSDLIHWSQPGLIMKINWWDKWFPDNCRVVGQAYPSLIDPNTPRKNFDYSAATPYLYYTQLNANQGGCRFNNNVNDRSLVRVRLRIQQNS